MTSFTRFAAAALCLSAASAAVAGDASVQKAGVVRKALDESARCLLDEKPGAVRSFLGLPADGKDAARYAGMFNKSGCVQSASGSMDLAFSPALLRGAFYKVLYIRDFEAAAPATGVAAGVTAGSGVGQLAECLVAKAPNTARSLVLAPAESELEANAFNALYGRVASCTPSGAPEFTKSMLTGLVAETLYRRAIIARPSASIDQNPSRLAA